MEYIFWIEILNELGKAIYISPEITRIMFCKFMKL